MPYCPASGPVTVVSENEDKCTAISENWDQRIISEGKSSLNSLPSIPEGTNSLQSTSADKQPRAPKAKVVFEEAAGVSSESFNKVLERCFQEIAKKHILDLELASSSDFFPSQGLNSGEIGSQSPDLFDAPYLVSSGVACVPPSIPTVSECAMAHSSTAGSKDQVSRTSTPSTPKSIDRISRPSPRNLTSVVSVEAAMVRVSTSRTSRTSRTSESQANRMPSLASFRSTVASNVDAVDSETTIGSKKGLTFADALTNVAEVPEAVEETSETSDREFALLATWRKQSTSSKNKYQLKMARNVSREDLTVLKSADYDSVDADSNPWCCKHIIMTPGSPFRFFWDVIGTFLVLYDFIMIPLSVFDLYEGGLWSSISYGMLAYWSTDMVLCFLTGYLDNRNGLVVTDPKLIASRYLQTWFVIDALVLSLDWITSVIMDVGSKVSYGTFLRVVRIIRCVRLIRLLKVSKLFVKMREMMSTEVLTMMLDVLRLTTGICFFSHLIACIFYEIGKIGQRAGDDNWLDAVQVESPSVGSKIDYLYTTSVHWSLTQFTPASMEVAPRNTRERVFTIVVIISGFLVFSSMISEITTSLVQMRKLGEDEKKQFWKLRRFLIERGVPYVLSTRIRQYLENTVQMHGRHVREDNVGILLLLSDQLYKELQYNIKIKHIANHTLFDCIISVTNATILRLTTSMNFINLACADSLFFQNESSESMYFVVVGDLEYIQEIGLGSAQRGGLHMARHSVASKAWLCEPVLWTTWNHAGDLHAITECNLIAIDSSNFGTVIKTNPAVHGMVAAYASQFVQELRKMISRELTDLCWHYNYKHLTYTMRVFVDGDVGVAFDRGGLRGESDDDLPDGSFSLSTSNRVLGPLRRAVRRFVPWLFKPRILESDHEDAPSVTDDDA